VGIEGLLYVGKDILILRVSFEGTEMTIIIGKF
jgi:hypothetical protein